MASARLLPGRGGQHTWVTTTSVRPPSPGRWARLRAWAVRGMAAEIRAVLRDHDLMLLAAGVTFYAAVAVVPLAVVTLRCAGWLGGDGAVTTVARVAGVFLPNLGVPDAGQALSRAALRVPLAVLAASVLPASLYADGLRRALTRLGPARAENSLRRALRSRLLALGGFVCVTVTLLAVASLGAALTDGDRPLALSVYLAFLGGWCLATLALAVTYRLGSDDNLGRAALGLGSAATGSMVSGMTLGLVLLLRLPLSFGRAYGGFRVAGVLATVAGWLWLLHAVVLIGFVLTRRLEARLRQTPA
jgi:membrane protein